MPLEKNEKNKKNRFQFHFCLYEKQYKKLKELSQKDGLSMAEVLRTLIADAD